jgi:hypothetical protein
MYVSLTYQEFLMLEAIQDRAFQRALPEFSRIGANGQQEINVYWLFPWAWSDDSGNPRYAVTAAAVRAAWPAYAWFNINNFLTEARRRRYL